MLFNGTPLKHTTEATVQCHNHPHLTFLIQATYYKVTSVSTTWSSYSTLIYLPKEKEAYVQSSFTCNNPKRKTTQMSTKGWTHKQIMVQPYSEILLSGLKKNNYMITRGDLKNMRKEFTQYSIWFHSYKILENAK